MHSEIADSTSGLDLLLRLFRLCQIIYLNCAVDIATSGLVSTIHLLLFLDTLFCQAFRLRGYPDRLDSLLVNHETVFVETIAQSLIRLAFSVQALNRVSDRLRWRAKSVINFALLFD